MDSHVKSAHCSGFRMTPMLIGMMLTLLGVLVVFGWVADLPALKSISPGWATMKVNTALGFVCAGMALCMRTDERFSSFRKTWGQIFAASVFLIGATTLAEYALSVDFGIDQLFLKQPMDEAGNSTAGRMSMATSINFSLSGLALLSLNWVTLNGARPAFLLILLSGLTGLLALIGYLYGVESLYAVSPFSSMAAHTALGFLLLAVGLLFTRNGRGTIHILTSAGPAGASSGTCCRWLSACL